MREPGPELDVEPSELVPPWSELVARGPGS